MDFHWIQHYGTAFSEYMLCFRICYEEWPFLCEGAYDALQCCLCSQLTWYWNRTRVNIWKVSALGCHFPCFMRSCKHWSLKTPRLAKEWRTARQINCFCQAWAELDPCKPGYKQIIWTRISPPLKWACVCREYKKFIQRNQKFIVTYAPNCKVFQPDLMINVNILWVCNFLGMRTKT